MDSEPQADVDPTVGRVTVPSEAGYAQRTAVIASRWGADAVRNSDGTALDDDVIALGKRVYGAYFPARGHNDFIEGRLDLCPQMYLMSDRVVAGQGSVLRIDPMASYYCEQVTLNLGDDPAQWWEVYDRTSGEVVPAQEWSVAADGVVTIQRPEPFHEYTVSFLAYIVWDPVQMYNHLTNDWGDRPHEVPYDIRHVEAWEFVCDEFARWLAEHPEVDVVRFTTFFYQFALVFDERGREKFVDWFGYGATVSPATLQAFERERGYRLHPEDFVDQGFYNSSFRSPSQHFLDYLDFVAQTVARAASRLVEMAHRAGKQAMMFLGDQWIGTEPYGWRFASIGLDAVVGSVGDGTTLRMIADIPGVAYTEGRFLPYFFPDTFYEGANPSLEARDNWLKARRALLRSPVDRMGYGGYLSLADRFPSFIDEVARITQEFRDVHAHIAGAKPWCGLTVGVLNAWGSVRSWQAFTVAHALYSKQAYSYYGVLEALSGLPVETVFLSFDEVERNGIPVNIDVIISAGARDTAFSGGERWRSPTLVAAVRGWVRRGGGLVGVGEPAATAHQGRYFQVADCLGVEREMSQSLSTDKYCTKVTPVHFITQDVVEPWDFGESMRDVYAIDDTTAILEYSHDEVHLAAREAGQGRGVYIAGLPYSIQNRRLLQRALWWAARREDELPRWHSANPACEVNYYPASGTYCVANSTESEQHTTVFLGDGTPTTVALGPGGICWREVHS